jgi:1-acyl-sn-glycerol-3-phosphate acyltransferase
MSSTLADAPIMYRAVKKSVQPLLNRWLHLTVDGIEHVPTERPVILACNHLSFIDSLVLPLNLERPVYFLGKSDYFDNWRTRWLFDSLGVVPVRREGGSAGEASLKTGIRILEGGDIVGIYPEGTRSPDGRLYRGKTGPVRMALAAGVDIVPCAVIGTDKAQPTGKYTIKSTPVTMRYGSPISLARYADKADDPFALRAAIDEVMYEIMSLSGQEYVDEYASKVKKGEVTDVPSSRSGPIDVSQHREQLREAS